MVVLEVDPCGWKILLGLGAAKLFCPETVEACTSARSDFK